MKTLTFVIAPEICSSKAWKQKVTDFFDQIEEELGSLAIQLCFVRYEANEGNVRFGVSSSWHATSEMKQETATALHAVSENAPDSEVVVQLVQGLPSPDQVKQQHEWASTWKKEQSGTLFQIQLLEKGPPPDYFPQSEKPNSFFGLASPLPSLFREGDAECLAAIKRARPNDPQWDEFTHNFLEWLQASYGRPKQILWDLNCGSGAVTRTQPTLVDNGLVVLTPDAVTRVDFAGEPCWTWANPSSTVLVGATCCGTDGGVRICDGQGMVRSLALENGEEQWSHQLVEEPAGTSAPILDDKNNLYVTTIGGLMVVDALGSNSRLLFETNRRLNSAAIQVGSAIYIAGTEPRLHKAPMAGGKSDWGRGARMLGHAVSNPILNRRGELVIANKGGIQAFTSSGEEAWQMTHRLALSGGLALGAESTVLFTARGEDESYELVCADPLAPEGRRIQWAFSIARRVDGNPVVSPAGNICLADILGNVYLLNDQGQPIWTSRLGAPVHATLCCAENSIFILTADGRLAALAEQSS